MATKTQNGRTHSKKRMYHKQKDNFLKATHALSKAANNAKDKFSDVEESVEKYAKANPWKTMGFSLLAGAIVAQILHLRK